MHPRFHLHENPSFLHSNDLNIIYTFDYTFIKKVKGKKMYANSARMQNQRKNMERNQCDAKYVYLVLHTKSEVIFMPIFMTMTVKKCNFSR